MSLVPSSLDSRQRLGPGGNRSLDRSNAKDFTKFPALLNQHVDRVVAAYQSADQYMRKTSLRTEGLLIVKRFLESRSLNGLIPELEKEIFQIGIGDAKRLDSLVINSVYTSASRIAGREVREFVMNLFTRDHLGVLDKLDKSLYRQHLYNCPDDNDEQKVFHSDIFFPALKCWYFPHAVEEKDGPFMYVPFSPVLTDALLDWHQAQVEKIRMDQVEPWRGRGHREGSFRISMDEIASLGLKPQAVTVEPDTLVVANVFGFHRRGDTFAPCHRLSLHGSVRIDRPI